MKDMIRRGYLSNSVKCGILFCRPRVLDRNFVHLTNLDIEGSEKSTFSRPKTQPTMLGNFSKESRSVDTNTKDVQENKLLVVIGDNIRVMSIERYDFKEQRWLKGPEAFNRHRRKESVSVITEEKVYMIGGNIFEDETTKVDVFDWRLGKWSECNDLLEGRISAAAVSLDSNIYVSGGYNGNQATASCEKLDQQSGCWIRVADMLEGKWGHGACTMDGKIYVIGGTNWKSYFTSVECYSPETNSWTRLPPISTGRSGPGVAALDGNLYAVGGWDGNDWLKCMECFDPVDQKWTKLTDMKMARRNPGVATANGLIYVAGGFSNRDGFIYSVEVYDPRIDSWTTLPFEMREGKDWAEAAFLDWVF